MFYFKISKKLINCYTSNTPHFHKEINSLNWNIVQLTGFNMKQKRRHKAWKSMGFLSQNNIIAYKSIIFFEMHFKKTQRWHPLGRWRNPMQRSSQPSINSQTNLKKICENGLATEHFPTRKFRKIFAGKIQVESHVKKLILFMYTLQSIF